MGALDARFVLPVRDETVEEAEHKRPRERLEQVCKEHPDDVHGVDVVLDGVSSLVPLGGDRGRGVDVRPAPRTFV